MREMTDTPGRLVDGGRVHFGIFRTPFREVNLLDADIAGPSGLPPKALRNFRLKEWQHFGIISKNHFFGLAVVNAKMMGVSWLYMFDRGTGDLIEHKRNAGTGSVTLARELWNDRCSFRTKGYSIEIRNQLQEGRHDIDVAIEASKGRPAVKAELTIREDLSEVQPLVAVLRLKPNRPLYTHKVPCPIEGRVRFGETEVTLDPATDYALLDIHKSFYPYRTHWKWATFAGRDEQGKLIGANLTHNIITDDRDNNENAIWAGRSLSLLQEARFTIPGRTTDPWTIRTADGRVDLTFTPQGERSEVINLGLFVSAYHQPFGLFDGTIVDEGGKTRNIDGIFGIAEDHRVTW